MIHVKPKRNSVITVQFNTKSMGSETRNVEVLKILRAPNHDIVDNEEVWFEVNEKYSVDHAYVNFSRKYMSSPGRWIFLRVDSSWCYAISGIEEEVFEHIANIRQRKACKASRTASGILVVSVGELITVASRTEMQIRTYAHHAPSSLPVIKERFLAKPKFRLKNGLTFLIINENTIAYDVLHEPYAKNKIQRLVKSTPDLKLCRGVLLGKAKKPYLSRWM